MQDVLNRVLPSKINEQKVEVKINAGIEYSLKDEIYANSSKTEELELENNNGVWTVNLTDFIQKDDIKDRKIIISVDIMGEWGKISNYSYVINYDKDNTPDSEDNNNDNNINDSNENESQDNSHNTSNNSDINKENESQGNNNTNKENNNSNSDLKTGNNSVNSPKTGDNIEVWICLMMVSTLGIVGIWLTRRKQ